MFLVYPYFHLSLCICKIYMVLTSLKKTLNIYIWEVYICHKDNYGDNEQSGSPTFFKIYNEELTVMSGRNSLLISKNYGHDRYVNNEKYPVEINRIKKLFWIKAKFFRRGDKKAKKTLKSMKLMITSWKLQGNWLIFLIFYY